MPTKILILAIGLLLSATVATVAPVAAPTVQATGYQAGDPHWCC